MPSAITSSALLLAGTAAAATAAVLTQATLGSTSQLFGRTLIAGNDPKEVVLTFDDGPNEPATEQLLELLAEADAKAAFFMIGRFARQRPDLVRKVHAAGHAVCNHTETHPWLVTQSRARIREELRACNETLQDALGERVHFFRPPHGARRPAVLQIAAELKLSIVQWNVMGEDWKPIGVEGILSNVEHGLRRSTRAGRGANILLHDGWDVRFGGDRTDTVAATSALLQRFRVEGRRVLSLETLATRTQGSIAR